MTPIWKWLVCMTFAGLLGCSGALSSATGGREAKPPAGLEEAMALWAASGIENYQITVQQSCFCLREFTQPLRVTVYGDQVANVTGLEQPLSQREQLDTSRLTVAGLFAFIGDAQRRDVERLEVRYHPDLGYPVEIAYDGHAMIADDEWHVSLSELTPE
ncbi:MAG: DUF6174 domain-containing protein [Marinobacter sp.]|uniref:DUF6174 domain-containing protein n=1 Tax=Marinobacter sp. TaxID=50741 RepID=UPI00299DAA65|nr:DUF6174 domain-containing protein [Marinobacter sp.]MDX1755424.1 DUF6174 domain-containing protein [Marinobacter sp.]